MANDIRRKETAYASGQVIECKERKRNGVRVGVVVGHFAAFSVDLGGRFGKPDRFHPGAFLKSIQEHKDRDMRPVNLRDHHGRTVGGFPIQTVKEDKIGLFGEGEINLEVQQGAEAYSLAKQGVLSDFSIGWVPIEVDSSGSVRDIFEADIIEGSIVDEPMNRDAQIFEVKGASYFQDLPLASQEQVFNLEEAKARIEDLIGPDGAPSDDYAPRFLWHDQTQPKNLEAYFLQFTDVVEGKVMVIPQAIFKAAENLIDGSAGIPSADRAAVICHVERYYAKMGVASPFDIDEKQFYGSAEVADLDRRSLERVLIQTGRFSKKAATGLAASLRSADPGGYDGVGARDLLDSIRGITKSM